VRSEVRVRVLKLGNDARVIAVPGPLLEVEGADEEDLIEAANDALTARGHAVRFVHFTAVGLEACVEAYP